MNTLEMETELKGLPELVLGKGMYQNKYHAYDVYGHTEKYVESLKEMTDDKEMIAIGYLHDIGKPVLRIERDEEYKVRKDEPGYDVFKGHEERGEHMILEMRPELFKKYELDQNRIAKFVGAHFIPMTYFLKMQKETEWDAFVEHYKTLNEALEETHLDKDKQMMMFIADLKSKGPHCEDMDELLIFKDAIGNKSLVKKLYELQGGKYGNKK